LSILEIAIPIVSSIERIAIDDRLDSPEPGKFDDLTKIDGAPIEAGR
jgi:hypothetical protein